MDKKIIIRRRFNLENSFDYAFFKYIEDIGKLILKNGDTTFYINNFSCHLVSINYISVENFINDYLDYFKTERIFDLEIIFERNN